MRSLEVLSIVTTNCFTNVKRSAVAFDEAITRIVSTPQHRNTPVNSLGRRFVLDWMKRDSPKFQFETEYLDTMMEDEDLAAAIKAIIRVNRDGAHEDDETPALE